MCQCVTSVRLICLEHLIVWVALSQCCPHRLPIPLLVGVAVASTSPWLGWCILWLPMGWTAALLPMLHLDCLLHTDCCHSFGGISDVELDYSVLTVALGNTKKCKDLDCLVCFRLKTISLLTESTGLGGVEEISEAFNSSSLCVMRWLCSSWSSVLTPKWRQSGCGLQLVCCTYLQL